MFTPKLPEHKHRPQLEREQLETISLTVGVLSSYHLNLLNLAMNDMGKFWGSDIDDSKLVRLAEASAYAKPKNENRPAYCLWLRNHWRLMTKKLVEGIEIMKKSA